MHLKEFETKLEELIGRPTELRPFVCDGSPIDCNVFIVGFNPATSMECDFWEFWRSDTGFDKRAWFDAYIQDRRTRPLKPGKTRRAAVSNSRRVIEWILESAAPARCLETNIYAAPSEQITDLASEKRLTAPFDFLLSTIKPKLIIAHGTDAARHCQSMTKNVVVWSVSHFSRGWSQSAAIDLGLKIKAHLQ